MPGGTPSEQTDAIAEFASALTDHTDVEADGDFWLEIDSGLVVSQGTLAFDDIDGPMQIDSLVGTVAGLLVDVVTGIKRIAAGASARDLLATCDASEHLG